MTEDQKNRYTIDTVATACSVIEAVAMSREPLGIADIAKTLGLTPNMAMRQVVTLEQAGIFTRINERFTLGMKLAIYWARKKSLIEGVRSQADRDLETIKEGDAA